MATTTVFPEAGRALYAQHKGLPRHRLSCGRKKQYLTREEAQTALERWIGTCPLTLDVYECTTCGGWHHGNGPTH
jgi:hypothetical protein